MSNALTYKGFSARIEFDAEDRIFVGRVAGIRDVVGFHAKTVAGLETAFHEAVNDYMAACAALGQSPSKPVSGNLMLRVPKDVHASAIQAAELAGVSLNQWAADALRAAARSR
ncbi:MAG: type II toxin-antitoxin system HicB family antitoxin [Burkholderiales bacterium]|nr:type II toxin-antitoxin system HicB family antitoxin [Pseudomonadota bacterium]MCC7066865.1 type II toxin-antitoxin system HicB family antitoxin [Burkholderiales bacterium]